MSARVWVGTIVILLLSATGSGPAAAKCVDRNKDGTCNQQVEAGRCLIEVGGKKYFDGKCRIELDNILNIIVLYAKPYAVFITVEDEDRTRASRAYWNGVKAVSHANDSLGPLKAEGSSCWLNSTAKICGWW